VFEPNFEPEYLGYVCNYLRTNHWRVASTVPFEDAQQEAYCVFLKCKRVYSGKVTEPAHFMALFKTAWSRRFTDLSNENTEEREHITVAQDDEVHEMQSAGATDNDGYLATMIRQAPSEVNMVLSLFLNAPQELLEVALAGWRGGSDKRMRSGGSKHINRLLGLPEDQDTLKQVSDYFTP
jgi:hypothetical protein